MAECVVQLLVEKENLNLSSKTLHCDFSYCPSSITISNMQINDKQYYYLYHIPHFHKSILYHADPSHLHSFLQIILYTHSGLQYFETCLSFPPSNNPSQIILHQIIERKRTEFIHKCKTMLSSSAVNTFGQAIHDDVVKMTREMDGRLIENR